MATLEEHLLAKHSEFLRKQREARGELSVAPKVVVPAPTPDVPAEICEDQIAADKAVNFMPVAPAMPFGGPKEGT